MPAAANSGLQEPDDELAVVQQVFKGRISSVRTKALLTVKLPGVASADDVQVRCTISSVSVTVSGRYLLQLPLPFRIKDEAESVRFSSKKQPATLTVTMTVEGSIQQQQQQQQQQPNTAASQLSPALASSNASNQSSRRRRQQQQGQQQTEASGNSSSSSTATHLASDINSAAVLSEGHPVYGDDRSKWLLPFALAADYADASGAGKASSSLLWTLSPYPPPEEGPPEWLVRLTPGNLVFALLTLLTLLIMGAMGAAYVQGYSMAQALVKTVLDSASGQLRQAYLAYNMALSFDNSLPATLIKLAQAWLTYSTLWWLLKLLRLNVLLGWVFSWDNVVRPLLLGLFWQLRLVFMVPFSFAVLLICVPVAPSGFWFDFLATQAMIMGINGRWPAVALLLLSSSFYLPRLPRFGIWPCYEEWIQCLIAAGCIILMVSAIYWSNYLLGAAAACVSFCHWRNARG